MPGSKPMTDTQLYKIYALLNEKGEMTNNEIASQLDLPIQSVRRILLDLTKAGRAKKHYVWRLKEN